VETPNGSKDTLVDWLFRAYVGTREIHQVDSGLKRYFVAVNDSVTAPRIVLGEHHQLLFVPSSIWSEARAGRFLLPDNYPSEPMFSWSRTPEHDNPTTWITQVRLTNIRCFEQITLSFREGMNVLIGQNGAGKTTILDALAHCLASLLFPLYPRFTRLASQWSIFPHEVRVARIEKG